MATASTPAVEYVARLAIEPAPEPIQNVIKTSFISIITLYNYTQMNKFEEQCHLIFLLEDFPEVVLAQVNAILKAESIDKQYQFADKISLMTPEFGTKVGSFQTNVQLYEQRIEQKVKQIMEIDLALLKFIASVPERIEQNSFKLPVNVDIPYLVGEYMSIKEKQIVAKISKALELQNISVINSAFEMAPKLEKCIFDNTQYTARTPAAARLNQLTDNGNPQLMHDYQLLVDFCDIFFNNERVRTTLTERNISQIPAQFLTIGIDIRQVLSSLASMYSPTDEQNRNIRNFFSDGGGRSNEDGMQVDDIDGDESVKATSKRRRRFISRSRRESTIYAHKIMVLLVYFICLEDSTDPDWLSKIPLPIREFRAQLVITLNRMIEHLLEYIQFKANSDAYKIVFSRLPLVRPNEPFNTGNNRFITHMMYVLQYALNYAAFLYNAV